GRPGRVARPGVPSSHAHRPPPARRAGTMGSARAERTKARGPKGSRAWLFCPSSFDLCPGCNASPNRPVGDARMFTELDLRTREFYHRSLRLMKGSGIPFLVGGAYALARYTGVVRHTKDLDLFVKPSDVERVMARFADAGYSTERTYPH